MRFVWWLAGLVGVAQLAHIGMRGTERAWAEQGWILAPANALGAALAFYYWRRLRRAEPTRDQYQASGPLLPLALVLLLIAARYVPAVMGRMGQGWRVIFALVLLWFLATYIRWLIRLGRSVVGRAGGLAKR